MSNTIGWTSWFRTIAGLRYDTQWFDVMSNNIANSGKTHAALASHKLTLAFGPWSRTEIFVNGVRGFHSNDARGTTITVDPKTNAPVQRVQPLVRTTGYEADVNHLLLNQRLHQT